jgi:hypothetical protein
MASSTSMLSQQNRLLQLPAIAKLARWRFKQMWRFLAIAWLGMLAMVVLVCAGPLFSRVATSAYTRSLIASAPDGTYITVDAISTHPTQEQLQHLTLLAMKVRRQPGMPTLCKGGCHVRRPMAQ